MNIVNTETSVSMSVLFAVEDCFAVLTASFNIDLSSRRNNCSVCDVALAIGVVSTRTLGNEISFQRVKTL